MCRLRCRGAALRQLLAHVANQQFHLPATVSRTKKLGRKIGDLVRLVDDDRVRRAQQVSETIFFQRQVREQQVVIDDDDVGFDGLAARLHHVTASDLRAARTQAVFARRGDLRPQRMGVTQSRHFGEIATAGTARPAFDSHQRTVALATETALCSELPESIGAQVVGTALEKRDARRYPDGAGQQGQILVEQLILQGARAGGYQYPLGG